MDPVCEFCNKTFSRKCALQRHLQTIHHVTVENKKNITRHVCPVKECSIKNATTQDMRLHLIEQHGFTFNEDKKTFGSVQEFEKWKENLEMENKVSFKKVRGNENSQMYCKQYYVCNRSGYYSSKNSGKRVPIDSCKIGSICPAYLNVTISHISGEVNVVLMNTHIGHTHELKFLRLPTSLKLEIANQIKGGVNSEKVLEFIRNDIDVTYDRSHLLTKKDINNIRTSFGLKGIGRHSDDASSESMCFPHSFEQECEDEKQVQNDDVLNEILEKEIYIPEVLISLQKESNLKDDTLTHKKQKAVEYLNLLQDGIQNCDNVSLLDELNSKLSKVCKHLELNNKKPVSF